MGNKGWFDNVRWKEDFGQYERWVFFFKIVKEQ